MSSIPQGSAFFLFKKGVTEILNSLGPSIPKSIVASVPIGFGVVFYWLFRTPAEVIKTKVQTKMSPNITIAFNEAKSTIPNGLLSLYKHYHVMLWLDIPFQIINFILYGIISDAILHAGYETSIITRLVCGITCGMTAAAVTCPIDTCKTRMIGRDRAAAAAAAASSSTSTSIAVSSDLKYSSNQTDFILNKDIAAFEDLKNSDWKQLNNNNNNNNLPFESSIQLPSTNIASSSSGYATLSSVALLEVSTDVSEKKPVLDGQGSMSEATSYEKESYLNLPSSPMLSPITNSSDNMNMNTNSNSNVLVELLNIAKTEGPLTLFSGIRQRLLYTGLANGIRLAVYGTARMDLMMRSLDDI